MNFDAFNSLIENNDKSGHFPAIHLGRELLVMDSFCGGLPKDSDAEFN